MYQARTKAFTSSGLLAAVSALMESIAAEAGVALAPPLYSDALGAPGTPGATYDGMMRSNVETIVGALAA